MNRKQKAPWHRKQNNRRYHFRETWTKCDLSKSKIQYVSMVKPSRHLLTGLDKVYSAWMVFYCFCTGRNVNPICIVPVMWHSKSRLSEQLLILARLTQQKQQTTNTEMTSAIKIQHTAGPIIIVTFVHNETRVQFGLQGLWTKVLISMF